MNVWNVFAFLNSLVKLLLGCTRGLEGIIQKLDEVFIVILRFFKSVLLLLKYDQVVSIAAIISICC